MNDTKITRILMDMATVEEGLTKGHEAKAKLLRELAAEIEFPEKEHSPEKNPKPTPKDPFRIKVVPVADDYMEPDYDKIEDLVYEWIKKSYITAPPKWH